MGLFNYAISTSHCSSVVRSVADRAPKRTEIALPDVTTFTLLYGEDGTSSTMNVLVLSNIGIYDSDAKYSLLFQSISA